MADKQTDLTNLINQARPLLSPYLDAMVTPDERTLVETALKQDPALQTELELLQDTVTLLRQMPRLVAPRSFTLSQADIQPVASTSGGFWQLPWLKPLSGALAALAVVLVAGGIAISLLGGKPVPQTASVAMIAPQLTMPPAPAEPRLVEAPAQAQADQPVAMQEAAKAEESVLEPPVEAETYTLEAGAVEEAQSQAAPSVPSPLPQAAPPPADQSLMTVSPQNAAVGRGMADQAIAVPTMAEVPVAKVAPAVESTPLPQPTSVGAIISPATVITVATIFLPQVTTPLTAIPVLPTATILLSSPPTTSPTVTPPSPAVQSALPVAWIVVGLMGIFIAGLVFYRLWR